MPQQKNLVNEILQHIVNRLETGNIRHEVHTFDSGGVMVDIWKGNHFYVVKIDNDRIGLSRVTEDTGFDTVPDNIYADFEIFKNKLDDLLSN